MVSPVKYTHEIIDLAGKLDWHTQRGDVLSMQNIIKKLRNKINVVQHFINTYEVSN